MDYTLIIIVIIVIVVIAAVAYYYFYMRSSGNWVFFPMMDSPGGDKGHKPGLTADQLIAIAEKDPTIIAFNTNGWLKGVLLPRHNWNKWTNDSNKGLYVRKDIVEAQGLA